MSETEYLRQEVERLHRQITRLESNQAFPNFYYSKAAQENWLDIKHIPE